VPEREVKLAVAPSFDLPPLDDVADGVEVHPAETERLSATYYDTSDLRLTRWGVSFRYRTDEGWTVKLPLAGDSLLLVRDELIFPGSSRRAPAAAVDLVDAFARGAALAPQIRLRTLRRRTELCDPDGLLVAELVDDEVSVMDGRRLAARFREVEVEVRDDTPPGLLDVVVARLRSAGAGAPDPTPKVVRALGPRASLPPEVAVAEPAADASVADVVQAAIAASVVRLVRHDPVMRLDEDPEGVHQARVATRRLRSDLRTFHSYVEADWARELRDELGWLAAILGAVRDGDVLLGRLRSQAGRLTGESEPALTRALASLEAERDTAHEELLETLRSERYVALLDRLVAAANSPRLRPAVNLPAKAVLPPLAGRPFRALEKQAKGLGRDASDDELHALRIRTKRARYAAEAVAPVLGKRARAVGAAAADLQDVLGGLHDTVVAERWLREWANGTESALDAFAAGQLAGLERVDAEAARARWRKTWRRLQAVRPTAWLEDR